MESILARNSVLQTALGARRERGTPRDIPIWVFFLHSCSAGPKAHKPCEKNLVLILAAIHVFCGATASSKKGKVEILKERSYGMPILQTAIRATTKAVNP